ncbi:MAG: glycosyltransferase family 2 protein [Dissulfurispiraceae bacterium]
MNEKLENSPKSVKASYLVSIVVPTHNESENVSPLHQRIVNVFEQLAEYDFELIFADDSSDNTPQVIIELNKGDTRVKLIRLVRSFGQTIAIAAGLKRAGGDAAIMMDADLQDPPEVIPLLLAKWREGSKVVYVERPSSSSSLCYRVLARLFYRILTKISAVPIPIDAGEYRLLDRVVIDYMNGLKERTRFIRGLTVWPGYPLSKISIARRARHSGATNYNFRRSLAVAIDGFVSFSNIPLRIATYLGLSLAVLSTLAATIYLILYLFDSSRFGVGWMSLFLLGVFFGGVNLLFLGIIGEYIGRIFLEVQGRPTYLVDYEFGWESTQNFHQGIECREHKCF